jgi:hypothetical protein
LKVVDANGKNVTPLAALGRMPNFLKGDRPISSMGTT